MPVALSLIVSVILGLIIGLVKFLFEDIIGFSLIILFPLIYGIAVGYALGWVFSRFGSQRKDLGVLFAALSITVAILSFAAFERAYFETVVIDTLTLEGEDMTGFYLTWTDYVYLLGEVGTSVGFIVGPGLEITGGLYYIILLLEFGLMYYFAIQKVREYM